MTLHPKIIEKNSKKEFVVLPYEEWLELQSVLEDAQDLLEFRQAKQDENSNPSRLIKEVKQHFDV